MARLKAFNKKNINLTALVAAVRALAAEFPDFIYTPPGGRGEKCKYRRSKQPCGMVTGCGIGEALRRIGVSSGGLDNPKKWGLVGDEDTTIGHHLRQAGLEGEEVAWLATFQSSQDIRNTWADSVDWADRQVKLS